LISLEIFGGHDDDLAGESVAEGVEGGALLAGFGFGACGVLRIGSVDFNA
jgi:hypothetical protein